MRLFILGMLMVTLFSFAASHAAAEPANKGQKTNTISSDLLKSPGTVAAKAELSIARIDYVGQKSSPVCKKKSGSTCYKDGACCKGGTVCKILLSKIRKLVRKIPGETYRPVNFCF